jgi:hypothetical protein
MSTTEATAAKTCRSEGCGGEPWETGRYSPNTFPESTHGYCFTCAFWADHAANPNAGTVIIEGRAPHLGRERLEFDPALPVIGPDHGMRGFSGALWRVRFRDGRETETDNLWLQGTIPDRFLDRFPVNADLELLK